MVLSNAHTSSISSDRQESPGSVRLHPGWKVWKSEHVRTGSVLAVWKSLAVEAGSAMGSDAATTNRHFRAFSCEAKNPLKASSEATHAQAMDDGPASIASWSQWGFQNLEVDVSILSRESRENEGTW